MDVIMARALLGVSRSADAEQIKRAFRAKARRSHPDHGGCAAAFRRLVDAQSVALDGVPASVRRGAARSARWVTALTVVAPQPAGQRFTERTVVTPRRSPSPLNEAASSSRSFGEVLAREIAAA